MNSKIRKSGIIGIIGTRKYESETYMVNRSYIKKKTNS